jgi:hypothetical protein
MLNLAWQDTGHRAQRHCAYRLTNRLVNTAHFPGIHEVLHGRSFGHAVHALRSWIEASCRQTLPIHNQAGLPRGH